MVARYHDDRYASLASHYVQELIEKLDGLSRRNRAVEYVASNQQRIGLFFFDDSLELFQDRRLIIEKALTVQSTPQVQVSGVD